MDLPVGYHRFHPDPFLDYQLNRWHSLGFTRREDLAALGARIRTFDDYVRGFLELAEQARAEGRLRNAAFYVRAAEFLVSPRDERKARLYDEFQELFERAFAGEGLERHLVPYQGGHLPALRLAPEGGSSRGTVVAFGGFDSFIEDFLGLWKRFAGAGYEVIAFEGPGQGGALRRSGLPFDHDWEKPTAAILDHFHISEATLVGVSMGGYWGLRAAAFEKRIRRVIALPPVYDWMEMASRPIRWLVRQLLRMRGLMNFLVRLKMKSGKLRHTIEQTLYLTRREEPIDAVLWMMAMNQEHLRSDLVDQDVLLAVGEHDAFQPVMLMDKQKAALIHARSVTTRIFTKAEHADQHCQIGNLGLAADVMIDWLAQAERPAR